jgi:hypothetical protein
MDELMVILRDAPGEHKVLAARILFNLAADDDIRLMMV